MGPSPSFAILAMTLPKRRATERRILQIAKTCGLRQSLAISLSEPGDCRSTNRAHALGLSFIPVCRPPRDSQTTASQ